MEVGSLSVLLCFVVTVYGGSVENVLSRHVHPGCPLGFVHYRRSCYWFSVVKGSFVEAHGYCQYLGSHLATIESRDEDSFIRGHVLRHGKAEKYWLGGTDLNLEGKWLWEGQRPFGFRNWIPGQPDNWKHHEHCLEIRKHHHHYLWNDFECHVPLHFICEKEL
ncbi:perlucin-like isoform X1 [Haliotis asinina]|uniref:perlucin-like isoform X1 n=1 Tax=Haliotis asinina TaxID=109174 RepID=UPI0035320481